MEKDLLSIVRQLLEFPYPKICRHSIVCDILNILEKHGHKISSKLARAVVEADDETTLQLLQ